MHAANEDFAAYYSFTNRLESRLCVIATKKNAGKAHDRGRIRRLAREFFRIHKEQFLKKVDLIIIVRKRRRIKTYSDAKMSLLKLCRYIGIL